MAQLASLADAPNTLREYETIYILNPNTVNDKVGAVNDRVKGIIEERGGRILKVDNWGKRRLAYEVEKHRKGIYLYWQYLGSPEIVAEFERNMRMLDPVIRFMTIRLDEDVDPSARPSELDDESFERAAATAADEEELMLRSSSSSDSDADGDDFDADSDDFDGDSDSDDSDSDSDGDSDDEAVRATPEANDASDEEE